MRKPKGRMKPPRTIPLRLTRTIPLFSKLRLMIRPYAFPAMPMRFPA
ncbi:MAG: hypothetical protein LUE90_06895 [Clostridiales bacterium]|nr:hypothetical protein [Clostridiales bacterium]